MPSFRRLPIVAVLTAAAGAVHLAAAVPHFGQDLVYGGLFVAAGWSQLACAAALLVRPGGTTAGATALVNLGALAAWILSRTTGLPLGHPGVEPVALADGVTVAFELLAVALLVARWAGWRRLAGRSVATVGAVGLVGVLVAGGSTTAIASLGSAGHGHASAPTGDGHDDGHGPGTARTEDTQEASAPAHRHRDGTWHLHARGDAHEHPDGTVHVHRVSDARAPSPTTPSPTGEPAPTAVPDAGHGDGHDHTH